MLDYSGALVRYIRCNFANDIDGKLSIIDVHRVLGSQRTRVDTMAHTPSGDRFSALSGMTHHGVDSEPDTYMLDGDDFEVNVKTGFLPPQPPLTRLTPQYEIWEQTLDKASSLQLKLGERNDLTEKDRMESATWRRDVEEVNNAQ